ncbi:metal transporter CNNM2 isoform X2 [Contarinia nasturtii]|nr:metal transporter CNNM2 isoform X2 [Contarinia nasturtii]
MRIESTDKTIEYDDENIPELITHTNARLRLFGCGFTDHTVVTFTRQINDRNGACLLPASGQFKVSSEGLLEYTAIVDIIVPSAEPTPYYFCVKNAEDSIEEKKIDRAQPFIHQGTEAWLSMRATELILPTWLAIIIIVCCLCFSALFSGLNLGLMSLDRTELKILRNTGNAKERKYAAKIQPVRDHGNFLLCSILLGNVFVNNIFTILLDGLTSGPVAVLCSTLLIVVFGEITPQAICSRHGLAVGAKSIVITKIFMVLTSPLAYPVSKLLDVILGEEIGNVYNRDRLKELVRVTKDVNDLDKDEVNIISGALEMRRKTVFEVMTHLEDAFMLSIDAILDFDTVTEIMKSGFSRIPVYEGLRHNVQKLLFIKDLALIDPDDNTPLRTLCEFYQNPCFYVFEDVTLDVIFKQFKAGQQGHMAFVQRVNNEGDGDPYYETIGLVTLEDVIEEMIQAEIVDETDVYTDNRNKKKRKVMSRKHDFTMFAAERRDVQRIHISPQLTLATFQYLSTTVDAFKNDCVSETILRRILTQDVIHHIKIKAKEKDNLSLLIYEQGKPADYFVLILEGRVEVTVGQEHLLFECGPFTYFGTQALVQSVGVAESPQQGSLQSLNLDAVMNQTFVPDYSVKAISDVIYIAIKRTLYLAAKRATLMEKSKRYGGDSNEPIDYEVEKLLHSLDEDDRSVSAHTTNLNALSPRASKSASPTAINVEHTSNGPTSLNDQRASTPAVSFIPENQSIQFHTPEKESRETDALLAPQT